MLHVPFVDLHAEAALYEEDVFQAVNRVLNSKNFILGDEVTRFESRIKSYTGYNYAVAVSSGTDALIIALMAAGVGPGDEVITTPYSFIATSHAITRVGAKPVYVDIDSNFNMNPLLIQDAITENTKVIMPVSLFGKPLDMQSICRTLAGATNPIYVIEDAAQCFRDPGEGFKPDLCCYSFFPTKILGGCGDGGAVVTEDSVMEDKLRCLRTQGAESKNMHTYIGGNFRMDAIQAAILTAKIYYLDLLVALRVSKSAIYDFNFKDALEGIVDFPSFDSEHLYSQYVIKCHDRNSLKSFLKARKIDTQIYYPLSAHLQPCYEYLGYATGAFPMSEEASDKSLALPIYPSLTIVQQMHVINTIKQFYTQP